MSFFLSNLWWFAFWHFLFKVVWNYTSVLLLLKLRLYFVHSYAHSNVDLHFAWRYLLFMKSIECIWLLKLKLATFWCQSTRILNVSQVYSSAWTALQIVTALVSPHRILLMLILLVVKAIWTCLKIQYYVFVIIGGNHLNWSLLGSDQFISANTWIF